MSVLRLKKLFILGVICIVIPGISFSQDSYDNALSLYKNKDYEKALATLNPLLANSPTNSNYHYLAGKVLYELESDWKQCLIHFRKAANGISDPMLNYYLGRAYLSQLNPEKALLHLLEYKTERSRFEMDNTNHDLWIAAAKNLTKALTNTAIYTALDRQTLDEEGYINYNTHHFATGSWIKKDAVFFINTGVKSHNQYIFQPSLLNKTASCLFFTGQKGLFNQNNDIFIYCETNQMEGSQLTKLPGVLNSSYDETNVVFVVETNMLYFSSNRPEGLGGYDIYVAEYFPHTDSWSRPRNLGFPVNTPFDEYFMGPGSVAEDGFYLSTNRYNKKGLWTMIELTPTYQEPIDLLSDKNNRIAAAQFNKITLKAEEVQLEEIKHTAEVLSPTETIGVPLINEAAYNIILEKALDLQLKADSIHRLADEQRYLLSSTDDTQNRMVRIRKIEAFDDEAESIQKKADIEFAKARKIEIAAETAKPVTSPETSTASINTPKPEVNAEIIRKKLSGTSSQHENTKKEHITKADNKFAIHATSIYSAQNPFDMNYQIGNGLLYRIQLGVFSKKIDYDYFGGLWPITGEIITNRELKKYYAGLFIHRNNAEEALLRIRKEGFTDAFIVAWFNNKKVSLNRATDIEKTLFTNSLENEK